MKAVIMAGGKGTRVASITHDAIPKPMLKVGSKTILEHQIDCLRKNKIEDIILVIGHLGECIESYFGDGKKFGVHITYIKENPVHPLGTAGALYFLKDKIKEDFILLFGDIMCNVDFGLLYEYHVKHCADVTLLTHPNSHPYDSDLIVVSSNNQVVDFKSKERKRGGEDYSNLVNSGVYVLNPRLLTFLDMPKKCALEKDLIFANLNQIKVVSYRSTEYVKDMGTRERYDKVVQDYYQGKIKKRNLSKKQKCIFLDRDGVINEYRGLITKKDDICLINGVSSAIKKINDSDFLCIVITNQPIIARGDCSVEELNLIHKRIETILGEKGAYIDDLFYCPHHPDDGFKGEVRELKIDCNCRKPKIGLFQEAAKKYNIDLTESYMIGDTWRDIEAGLNAKMKVCYVESGEKISLEHPIRTKNRFRDLNLAVNYIIERKKMDFVPAIKKYYKRELDVVGRLNYDEINDAMNAIYETYQEGGTIYVCGNGGSASTASHMQNDFNKGISEYTDLKFNFYCLNDNISTVMAIANDIGYEEVFRFQLKNKITDKDLLIGISGSGNSKNVLNAVEYAHEVGAKVIGMTGYSGGKLKEMADYRMHVKENDMQIAEDIHMTFDHMMMKIFYNLLVNREVSGDNIMDVHC